LNFIKSEYSFKKIFYPLEKAVEDSVNAGHDSVCLIDDTPFGFVKLEQECIKHGIKPIYGLSTIITDSSKKARSKYDTCNESEEVILIARSQKGLCDLYRLYTKSTERYNRFLRLLPSDLIDSDLIVISNKFHGDYYKKEICHYAASYASVADIPTYQCIAGTRGPIYSLSGIVSDEVLESFYGKDAVEEKNFLPTRVDDIVLKKADMISYNGSKNFETECWAGLKKLGLDGDEYTERMKYEIEMIKSKNFQDYFMIVSDMISSAREDMIVGPGRGSSGGSLVCYAMGITNIDPIKFGLIFERFIDVHRSDYPDIDTDYPDVSRGDVIAQTARKYKGVNKLAVISKYSPRTILNDFAKAYDIPPYEMKAVKDTIIERSGGDARAKHCLGDTFKGEVGAEFLGKYPQMNHCSRAEGHARHFGTHAAGIIVLNEDVMQYGAIDKRSDILCLEGKDAEYLGLLKIDCLGLRTLSIIQNCLRLSGVDHNCIYSIPLEDEEVLSVFNKGDLSDIFKFDGDAIGMVCDKINVISFNDLVAITALGRPGALNSGGTGRYIKVNNGEQPPEYYGEIYQEITAKTNGIVVYQEQTMTILREFGGLSWEDVNIMRKIISKSRGDEFFSKYKEKFIKGAEGRGHSEEEAEVVWEAIASMGSYAFNKSHAVAYAMISYWCAYCKVKYPLNFLAANLNNAKDDDHALKLLRKYVKSHDIEYVTVDPDKSDVGWTIQDGVLVGGLTNIHGIGEAKAKTIIERRKPGSKRSIPFGLMQKLMKPVTIFDELYPLATSHQHIYAEHDITKIEDIKQGTQALTLGRLKAKDFRDRNDVQSVMKRGGTLVTSNQHYLNLTIEDDTGVIKGTIAPFDMDKLEGHRLAETLAIGEVIAIVGTVRDGWATISIKGVKRSEDI
jgi:DNA polymerase III alpha subunit